MNALRFIWAITVLHFSFSTFSNQITDLKTPFVLDDVIYVGIENPVTIVGEDVDYENIELICADTNIEVLPGKVKNNYFINIISNAYRKRPPMIKLLVVNKLKNDEVLFSKKFRIGRVPNPVVYFGKYNGKDKIDLQSFIIPKTIDIKLDSFEYFTYKVTKFQLIHIPAKSNKILTFRQENDSINTKMLETLQNVQKGDMIIIEDIWAVFFDHCGEPSTENKRLPSSLTLTFY
jgi:hypothetical protein